MKKYNWEFWAIPKIAIQDTRLSIEECFILGVLTTIMNGDNRAWPSQRRLAQEIHCSTRSVNRYTAHLEEHKWIKINREGGSQRVKDYEILVPPQGFDPDNLSRCQYCQARLPKSAKNPNPSIYLKEHKKEQVATEVAEWTSSDLKTYLNSMLENKNRGVVIIAQYLGWKGVGVTSGSIQLKNKQQAQSEVTRNVRAAARLKPYSDDQLGQTMAALSEHAPFDWTLETVGKYINRDKRELVETLKKMKK